MDSGRRTLLVSDRKGKLTEAEEYYSATTRLIPTYWKAHTNLALDLLRRGDLTGARAHLETAERLRPGRAAVQLGLGDLCAAEGRMYDATRRWQAALSIQPKDPETLKRLNRNQPPPHSYGVR